VIGSGLVRRHQEDAVVHVWPPAATWPPRSLALSSGPINRSAEAVPGVPQLLPSQHPPRHAVHLPRRG
jgi:hypothetical protein